MRDEVTLQLEVTRIRTRKPSGWGVAAGKTLSNNESVTVVGIGVGSLSQGDRIECTGAWSSHPTFGAQFLLSNIKELDDPVNHHLIYWLRSFKGIGPAKGAELEAIYRETGYEAMFSRLTSIIGSQRTPDIAAINWATWLKPVLDRMIKRSKSYGPRGLSCFLSLAKSLHKRSGGALLAKDIVEQVNTLWDKDPYDVLSAYYGFKEADIFILKNNVVKPDADVRIGRVINHLMMNEPDTIHELHKIHARANDEFAVPVWDMVMDGSLTDKTDVLLFERGGETYLQNEMLNQCEHDIKDRVEALADRQKTGLTFEPADLAKALPFKLTDEQMAAVQKLVDEPMGVLTGGAGTGKCLGKGTPVLMFDGSVKPVEKVQVGDRLMGPDSKPRKVLSLANGIEELYRVTPQKGAAYVVNKSHVLSLRLSERKGGHAQGSIWNVSVRDYLAANKTLRKAAKGWRAGVSFSEKKLPVDPYFLGVWLGDGATDEPHVTTADPEIAKLCYETAAIYGLRIYKVDHPNNRSSTYRIVGKKGKGHTNPITEQLKQLGVLGNKHIPRSYRTTGRKARLQVLAGLLDTDGSLTCNGYDFVSKRKCLAEDMAYVARSLGLAAYVKQTKKECVNNGVWGSYWRVSISGDTAQIPCRLPHKKAQPRKQIKNVLNTGISVKKIGVGEYFGFELSGDGLFLLGDFTVTHNTTLMRAMLKAYRCAGSGVNFRLAAPTNKAARRLAKQTGVHATSIHKLLQAEPFDTSDRDRKKRTGLTFNFAVNENNPIRDSLIIVDEMSMVDTRIMAALLRGIDPETCNLLMVGDHEQLAPVQEGQPFVDIMEANSLPVVNTIKLDRIMRQNPGQLLNNASAIRVRKKDLVRMTRAPDWEFISADDDEAIRKVVIANARKLYHDSGRDPMSFQIITPRRHGHALSTLELNKAFRLEEFNTPNYTFVPGDKGLCTGHNAYGLINGDVFKVESVESATNEMVISFDTVDGLETKKVPRDHPTFTQGWAITIHKFQGDEAPFIVLPISKTFGTFLSRSMLYTAITRAQKKVILVGDYSAFMDALDNEEPSRLTGFKIGVLDAA